MRIQAVLEDKSENISFMTIKSTAWMNIGGEGKRAGGEQSDTSLTIDPKDLCSS